jgi:hypothetical protein
MTVAQPADANIRIMLVMTFVRVGLNLRRRGKKDMQEFLRIASSPTCAFSLNRRIRIRSRWCGSWAG